MPSTVISAVGTPPSAAAVTITSAGSGCADSNSRSSRRCSLTSLPTGNADCRRIASRVSRCSVLTEGLPSVGWFGGAPGSLRPSPNALWRWRRQRLSLAQEPLGEHDLDDVSHGVLACPVALELDGECDPRDWLRAG